MCLRIVSTNQLQNVFCVCSKAATCLWKCNKAQIKKALLETKLKANELIDTTGSQSLIWCCPLLDGIIIVRAAVITMEIKVYPHRRPLTPADEIRMRDIDCVAQDWGTVGVGLHAMEKINHIAIDLHHIHDDGMFVGVCAKQTCCFTSGERGLQVRTPTCCLLTFYFYQNKCSFCDFRFYSWPSWDFYNILINCVAQLGVF